MELAKWNFKILLKNDAKSKIQLFSNNFAVEKRLNFERKCLKKFKTTVNIAFSALKSLSEFLFVEKYSKILIF